MSNHPRTGSEIAHRESLRKYYDDLMKEVEEENQESEDKLQKELMTEDPLSVNYARGTTKKN